MFRSSKSQLTSVVGLVLVALAVVFAPASAMAGGKKPPKPPKTPHPPIVIHHEHHVHFHPGPHIGIGVFVGGGFGYHGPIVGSGGYVINNPVVNPIVNPVVSPVVNPVLEPIVGPVPSPVVLPVVDPVASQAVYTLFYADSQGQTQTYGQYVATSYASGTTDWGGLIEARDQLTANGVQCWVSAGTPTTATTATTATPAATAAMAATSASTASIG